MSGFYYLAYASTITRKGWLNPNTLYDIITVAHAFNAKHEISGFLCYGTRQFFQYIEGTEAEIKGLYQSLLTDDRHKKLQILAEGYHPTRRFNQWSRFGVTFDQFITENVRAYEFMPFRPYQWSEYQVMDFVALFEDYYSIPNRVLANLQLPIVYNDMGVALLRRASQHQLTLYFYLFIVGLLLAILWLLFVIYF
ncbi:MULTISPECIES: BLUF domain-containing protein [unclassified Moraxella]|uniref:BLUF domain-containing protein n=1 Tax=unclassified Moraxella TaxID=2685852 RepID=UPI003AF4C5BC